MSSSLPEPPSCEQKPHEITFHGHTRVDPFYWLRERENPALIDYLNRENAYTNAFMADTAELRASLFEEMRNRWKENDSTLPTSDKSYWYFSRSEKGLNYKRYCRLAKAGNETFLVDFVKLVANPDADVPVHPDEQVMLDLNVAAKEEGVEYLSLGEMVVSPNERFVAYSLDLSNGREVHTVIVKDLTTGKEIRRIKNHSIYSDVAWGADNVLFYQALDDTLRPHALVRHELDRPADQADTIIFTEPDELYWVVGLHRTSDDAYVLVQTASKTTTEYRYVSCTNATGDWKVFHGRVEDLEYTVSHHTNIAGSPQWIIVHNGDGATNFKVSICADSANTADRKNWVDLIPYDSNTNVEGVEPHKDFLVINVRRDGFPTVLLLALNSIASSRPVESLPLPSTALVDLRDALATVDDDPEVRAVNCLSTVGGDEFQSTSVRVAISNAIVPRRVYDVDASTLPRCSSVLLKQEPVMGGYDPSLYAVRRVWASTTKTTCDVNDPTLNLEPGNPVVRVPMTVCYRKDMFEKGKNPCLIYAYGSYGISADAAWSSQRLSLLDRGFVYAQAAIRGGGEFGRVWKNAGRMEHKMNTFTDFIACAETLIAEGWSAPDKLACRGGSAGGMLVGTVTNMRPEFFRTTIALVPFVDCLTTMLDPTIPLTVTEYIEWGNPAESKDVYDTIHSYAPVDNVRSGVVYPNIFIETGISDARVAYWEPSKWCAKLRTVWQESAAAGRALVYRINMEAGHGGYAGARYKQLEEIAFEYAFLLKTMGINK